MFQATKNNKTDRFLMVEILHGSLFSNVGLCYFYTTQNTKYFSWRFYTFVKFNIIYIQISFLDCFEKIEYDCHNKAFCIPSSIYPHFGHLRPMLQARLLGFKYSNGFLVGLHVLNGPRPGLQPGLSNAQISLSLSESANAQPGYSIPLLDGGKKI